MSNAEYTRAAAAVILALVTCLPRRMPLASPATA